MLTDGQPSVEKRNSGLSSLIAEDTKGKSNRYFRTSQCLIHEENLCAKSLEFPDNSVVQCSTSLYFHYVKKRR